MRRVEDIRTEDFIQSAMRSQLFDLREATVVKIDRSSHIINITFSYDTHHLKVRKLFISCFLFLQLLRPNVHMYVYSMSHVHS